MPRGTEGARGGTRYLPLPDRDGTGGTAGTTPVSRKRAAAKAGASPMHGPPAATAAAAPAPAAPPTPAAVAPAVTPGTGSVHFNSKESKSTGKAKMQAAVAALLGAGHATAAMQERALKRTTSIQDTRLKNAKNEAQTHLAMYLCDEPGKHADTNDKGRTVGGHAFSADEWRDHVEDETDDLAHNFLSTISCFDGMAEAEMYELVSRIAIVSAAPGESVIAEGEVADEDLEFNPFSNTQPFTDKGASAKALPGVEAASAGDTGPQKVPPCMYILWKGSLDVLVKGNVVRKYKPADFFGEIVFLYQSLPRTASVLAGDGTCKLVRIGLDCYKWLCSLDSMDGTHGRESFKKQLLAKSEISANDLRKLANAATLAKFQKLKEQKTITEKEYEMLIDGQEAADQRQHYLEKTEQKERSAFKYGEIKFQETGSRVPYLIIPDHENGRDPELILRNMTRHLKFQGKALEMPNIAFDVRARGKSYLEWAEQIYDNDFLAERWDWKRPALQRDIDRWETTKQNDQQEDKAQQQASKRSSVEKATTTAHAHRPEAARPASKHVGNSMRQPPPPYKNYDHHSVETIKNLHTGDLTEATKKKALAELRVIASCMRYTSDKERVDAAEQRYVEICKQTVKDQKNSEKQANSQRGQSKAGDRSKKDGTGIGSYASVSRGMQEAEAAQVEHRIEISEEGRHMEILVERDDAIRDFGDKLLAVFQAVVQGVVNSKGWFLFPAGRRPRHQLIGDTIATYGGDLHDTIWIQYATLKNPSLLKRYTRREMAEDPKFDEWTAQIDGITEDGKINADKMERLVTLAQENGVLGPGPDARKQKTEELKSCVSHMQDEAATKMHTIADVVLASKKVQNRATDALTDDEKSTMQRHRADAEDVEKDLAEKEQKLAAFTQEVRDAGEKRLRHEKFVAEIRSHARRLDEHDEKTPDVEALTFPAEEVDGQPVYPSVGDIQGNLGDFTGDHQFDSIGGENGWLRSRLEQIGDADITLHPRTTHLIFWDSVGTQRNGGQHLPWTEVDKFHEYLSEIGIAEGSLICNGDRTDITATLEKVKKSSPVIAVKTVGGASEKVAQFFEDRMFIDPDRDPGQGPNRPKGYADRYPPQAIDSHYHDVIFSLPAENVDEQELIVVDAVNPSVGQVIQRQMAELLAMSGGDEEKQLGFAAAERARFHEAWWFVVLYSKNAQKEKILSDVLNYIMMLLIMFVVVVVVLKTAYFPSDNTHEAAKEHSVMHDAASGRRFLCDVSTEQLVGLQSTEDVLGLCAASHPSGLRMLAETEEDASADAAPENQSTNAIREILKMLIIVLPMASGILLTINNAFSPMQKCTALDWAAHKMESQIYQYRSRALHYSNVANSGDWNFKHGAQPVIKSTAKRFVSSIESITTQIGSETQIQMSSLTYMEEKPHWIWKDTTQEDEDDTDEAHKHTLGERVDMKTNTFDPQRMQYSTGLEASMRKFLKFPKEYEGEASQDELDKFDKVYDDGYKSLGADQYLMVRTKPLLDMIKKRQKPLALRKDLIQALVCEPYPVSIFCPAFPCPARCPWSVLLLPWFTH
jgi:hypothetical protein